MLKEERRARLREAMAEAGIDAMVVYGNAWQGDYLRYAADFGILEGHGIAVVDADGSVELFLDSAVEAERAEAETAGIEVGLRRRDRPRRRRAARRASPITGSRRRRVGSCRDSSPIRRAASSSRTAPRCVDRLLMHKLPAELDAMRRAAQARRRWLCGVHGRRRSPGRRQYELDRRCRGISARARAAPTIS